MRLQIIIKISALCTLLFSMLAAVIFYGADQFRDDPQVTIGAVLPLSGPAAGIGEDVRDGMILALETLANRNSMNGYRLAMEVIDGAAPDQRLDAALDQLYDQQEPLAVITASSLVSAQVRSVTEHRDWIQICVVANAPELTVDTDRVFRFWPTAEFESEPLADIVPPETTSLAVVHLDDTFGTSMFQEVAARLERRGVSVHGEPFSLGHSNFSDIFAMLLEFDAIIVIGYHTHIADILSEARRQDYAGTMISNSTATLPEITTNEDADRLLVVAPAIYNDRFQFANEAKSLFEQRFQRPLSHYSATGFDVVMLLDGLLANQEPTAENLRNEFSHGFVFPGIIGNVTLTEGDQEILFPVLPAHIENQRIVFH